MSGEKTGQYNRTVAYDNYSKWLRRRKTNIFFMGDNIQWNEEDKQLVAKYKYNNQWKEILINM